MKKQILLIIICITMLITGCFSSKTENENKNENKTIKIEINENDKFSIEKTVNSNNEIILTIKNKTNEIIDYANIDIAFFNEKGNLINTEKQFIKNIIPKGDSIIKINTNNQINQITPSNIEITLNPMIYETKYETIYTDKVSGKISKTDTEGELNLIFNNDSRATINELNASVVFYKNKKIVDVYSVAIQNVGETANEKIYVPMINDENGSTYIEYDEVKLNINNASSNNS